MLIVSIINNKGGVGKSTCSTNLAHALALKGLRVLVVDADSQANTSSIFCPTPIKGNSLLHVLRNSFPIEKSIYATGYENLFCLPNHSETATLEVELSQQVPDSYFFLRKSLRQDSIRSQYNICLIDCPPNLGIFVLQAFIASDCVIVPVECGSRYSTEGLDTALGYIEDIKNKCNSNLFFLRLLVNKVEMRSKQQKAEVAALRTRFGEEMVFNTVIPRNPLFVTAENNFNTIIREASNSVGAKKFRALAEEFIEILRLQHGASDQASLFG